MFYPFFVKTYGVSNFWSIVQYVGKDIVDITSNSNFLIVVPHPESVLSLENSLWEWLPVNTNETSGISKTSRTFLITDSAKTSPISGKSLLIYSIRELNDYMINFFCGQKTYLTKESDSNESLIKSTTDKTKFLHVIENGNIL